MFGNMFLIEKKLSPVARKAQFREQCVPKDGRQSCAKRVFLSTGYVAAKSVCKVVARFYAEGIRKLERCRNWNADSLDCTYPVCEQECTLAARKHVKQLYWKRLRFPHGF